MAQQTPQITAPSGVEVNGINVIAESERKGRPAAPVLALVRGQRLRARLSYGSFVLGFGLSFWQASIAGVIGIVLSFLACGFVALAGKRGSAPTHGALPRRVRRGGNKLPSALSWLLWSAGRPR